jgi:hypothetical protein
MNIPKDPYMLLSFINTKLRDEYSSLDDLCHSMDIDRDQLEVTLKSIQYGYTQQNNCFTSLI